MNYKYALLVAIASLGGLVSCSDDEETDNLIAPITDTGDTSNVEFAAPPSAALVASGTVEVIVEPTVRYHVLEFAGVVTSTIVESETGIVIVDVGISDIVGSGTELRAYADALGKPMSIIVTHAHRDHFGNLDVFLDTDVYAETSNAAALMADELFAELYPGTVNAVTGTRIIADLDFNFNNIPNAETVENGFINIESVGALFAGDLIFNRAHGFIREYTPLDDLDEIDSWTAGLVAMKADHENYKYIFVGHNKYRTDVGTVIDENIAYLSDSQGLIKGTKELTTGGLATTAQQVVDELGILYPNYASGGLVLALPDFFFPGDPGAIWFE